MIQKLSDRYYRHFSISTNLFPGDSIPPDSTLIFDVELVQVQDGEVPPNVFKEIDTDGDQHLTRDEVSTQACGGTLAWKDGGNHLDKDILN